jgi:hypothetical protein
VPARDTLTRALLEMDPTIVFGGIGTMTLDDLLEALAALAVAQGDRGDTLVFRVLTLALAVLEYSGRCSIR